MDRRLGAARSEDPDAAQPARRAVPVLADRASQLDVPIRLDEDDPTVWANRSEREDFGVKRRDAARREVRDAHDQAAQKRALVIPLSHRG